MVLGMHARLRPVGGRSGQGFSLYHDKECESQLTIAHAHGPDRALGLCSNPRSKGDKPASKQKVVHVRRPGRRPGTHALMAGRLVWAGRTARVSMDCCVRAQTALAARPRSARLRTLPRVLLLERLCQSLRCAPEAEPTTCFKIREVLGVSMCTEKIDRLGEPMRAGPQR